MPDRALSPELTIWTDAQHADLVLAVVQHLGPSIRILGLGGPRSGPLDQLARQLSCPSDDDFRRLLDKPPACLFLAASTTPTASELAAALPPETLALTLEPLDLHTDLAAKRSAQNSLAGRVFHVPAFIRSPGWQGAADPLSVVGPAGCLALTSVGRPEESSLYARLFDAWFTLATFVPLPENIDASLTLPTRPPQRLEEISGHLCAHARLPGDCTAALTVSDRAAAAARTLLTIGPGGQFQVTDTGYELKDAAGNHLDGHEADPAPPDFAKQVAADIRRLIERRAGGGVGNAGQTAPQTAHALACCQACWLSCRTGQPESPAQLMNLR